MLLRLTYLGATNALAVLRLLPMSDRDKDAEILASRRQIMVLERQVGGELVRFAPAGRAWLTDSCRVARRPGRRPRSPAE